MEKKRKTSSRREDELARTEVTESEQEREQTRQGLTEKPEAKTEQTAETAQVQNTDTGANTNEKAQVQTADTGANTDEAAQAESADISANTDEAAQPEGADISANTSEAAQVQTADTSANTDEAAQAADTSAQAAPRDFKQKAAAFWQSKGKPALKGLPKRWFIDAFTGMAQGLFVTLIAGTIVKTLGSLIGDNAFGNFLTLLGNIASVMMGAGIGAGMGSKLKAPGLVVFSAIVAGFVGAWSDVFITCTADGAQAVMSAIGQKVAAGSPGNPIGAYVTALTAIEISSLVAGKTKLDILLVPLTALLATLAGAYIAWPFSWLIAQLGTGIALATDLQPVLMGIIVAAVMGVLLTLPTSSAAIWVAVATPVLTGSDAAQTEAMLIAGGAAVTGCACHMVGFAVLSFKENGAAGLVSQGLGTSMLQIPNIMRRPQLLIPPTIAAMICGPIATGAFKLKCGAGGGGMGTCGFVGVIESYNASIVGAGMPQWKFWLAIALLFFVMPALICWALGLLMRKKGWIKDGDLKI